MPKAKAKTDLLVETLKDIPDEEFVSSGVEEVDQLLGGGFPRRRITQVYGNPGVGKSYLLAKCMANLKGKVLYVDAEFALNRGRLERLGVPIDKIDYIANSQLERVAEYVIAHVQDYDLIIIDTLAKLTPMTVTTNEVGTNAIGLVARQIGHFEAKLRPRLYTSKAAVIGINQVRANLGFGQAETQVFGGWAWGHAIDLNLKLYKDANNKIYSQAGGERREVGHWCSVKVEKSRVSLPLATTKFRIDYEPTPVA